MKKLLMALGGIFLVIIGLLVVAVVKGRALDKQSKAYADAAVVAIVSNWNDQALLDRASGAFMKTTNNEQLDQLFHRLRVLGKMTKYRGSKGSSSAYFSFNKWKWSITASYIGHADFQFGVAAIKINLIKVHGRWRILGFFVRAKPNARRAASSQPAYAFAPGRLTAVGLVNSIDQVITARINC